MPAGTLAGAGLEKAVKDALYSLWMEMVTPAAWAEVEPGQTVYLDNYQGGAFPKAAPMVSGPYLVVDPGRRELGLETTLADQPFIRRFLNYPEQLLAPAQAG